MSEILTDDEVDAYLDAVLRASGSSLRHYSMHDSLEKMRGAVRNIERAAAERMREACVTACAIQASRWLTSSRDIYVAHECVKAIDALTVGTKKGD
jgi:hypothetical protein